ncbi:hypothetical protein LIER_32226 [Lithospermum erythrorhizon]|uniref:Zinc finger GRF-type domain-containing protein n=1 Tax=Lithospermum erythrorhizon TaxID=34254 RepID=A0AAV3RTA8_LITER
MELMEEYRKLKDTLKKYPKSIMEKDLTEYDTSTVVDGTNEVQLETNADWTLLATCPPESLIEVVEVIMADGTKLEKTFLSLLGRTMIGCGRNAMEWVSFTKKNPGRRFVRCAYRVFSCRFWEWIDDPVSPLVCKVMQVKAQSGEMKVKVLATIVLSCLVVIVFLVTFGSTNVVCSCNCGSKDLPYVLA